MATGTEGDDVLRNNPSLFGDFIYGLGGNDTIIVDAPYGQAGRQSRMFVRVDGGSGFDTLIINPFGIRGVTESSVTVGGPNIGSQADIINIAVERRVIEGRAVFTSASGSWTTGNTIDEINVLNTSDRAVITVSSGGGDDRVRLGDVGQGSTVFAGSGVDVVDLSGVVAGGGAAFGEAGNDVVTGSAGADLIVGGSGRDTMVGGAGNDVFRFDLATDSTAADQDLIRDFSLGDLIDLSRIDADTSLAGDQAFSFIGSAAFSGRAGELRVQDERAPIWLVQGDTDGDGAADFEFLIVVVDNHIPVSGDFVL